MKTKIIIVSIALVAIISLGATKLVKNESQDHANAEAQIASAPIGGLMIDKK